MSYRKFVDLAEYHGWTLAQLRCDERPESAMLNAMDRLGLDRWERYVTRLAKEIESGKLVYWPSDDAMVRNNERRVRESKS